MRPTLPRLLRRTLCAALTLLLILFAIVQFNQHLLRHGAEALHADILALQLHPGTFTDLQRLQTKWGAWGSYDGECTIHHCLYKIALEDFLATRSSRRGSTYPLWLVRAYLLTRASPTYFEATVRLRDDHIWGADYYIAIWVVPLRPLADSGYSLNLAIDFGPRLFANHGTYRASALRRGYNISRPGGCTFCVMDWINLSPNTSASDITRLNNINFNCMTFFTSCRDLPDLLPRLSQESRETTAEEDKLDRRDCNVPIARLAQETDNIVLVRAVPASPEKSVPTQGTDSIALIEVLARIKDAHDQNAGERHEISIDPNVSMTPGNFFVFYRQPGNLQDRHLLKPDACPYFTDTPENRAASSEGIRHDQSVGEPYRPGWYAD